MMLETKTQYIAIAIIPLIFAITLHEAAHGYIANRFGDKTAWLLGRVTLNPLKHIDPIGTIIVPFMMLVFGGIIFGWAKPVPVNYQNLDNPRRDMALVAVAGPFANLAMALMWALINKINMLFAANAPNPSLMFDITNFINLSSNFGILINSALMVLNLIPLPPLDGSRVVSSLLPPHVATLYEKIEPYGIWILLVLIITPIFPMIMMPPVIFVFKQIKYFFGLA